MKIISDGKKFFVSDCTSLEIKELMRKGVNIKFDKKHKYLIAEDNIFNRILLDLKVDIPQNDIKLEDISYGTYLREYQLLDVKKSLKYKYIINRNKMGYGKTLEAIEYCRLLNLKRILVICPKSVITQWQTQFIKWWPEVEPYIKTSVDIKSDAQILVINYEYLQNDQKFYPLRSFTWDLIICDESHRIKSPNAKRTQRVKMLPTVRKMALTGTPILNRPSDLWSQLNWLSPKYSGSNYWAFTERFCEVEINNYGKKIVGLSPSDSAKNLLSQVLSKISIGGDYQPLTLGKNIIEVPLDMEKDQKRMYLDIKRLALDTLNNQDITIKNAMDQLVKLQLVTSSGVINEKSCTKNNPKFAFIKDWLEDTDIEKVVIFSKYAVTIKELQKYLGCENVLLYHGKLTSKDREDTLKTFKEGQPRVLAATIGSLGTGVDGLQSICNNAIFIDREWVPALNEQAEDRINRSGQSKITNIYILKCKDSIDNYVEELEAHKYDDIEELNKWIRSWS